MKIPLLIVGLMVLYVVLSSTQEPFNVADQQVVKHVTNKKKELEIKPTLLKGSLPIPTPSKPVPKCPISKKTRKSKTEKPKTEELTPYRENVDKYIKNSMLLKYPNHKLGFQPSNVREVELAYLKPTEIGKIPLFKGKVPDKIKIPKLTSREEEEDDAFEEE